MKTYIISILILISTTIAFAQKDLQDVVYLKNGSIIRGKIIGKIPEKTVKIETADGSVFVYNMDEVEKFAVEQQKVKSEPSLKTSGFKPGYRGIIEMGYLMGEGVYGLDRYKLNIINGYQINHYFALGFGTGLRYYFDSKSSFIPVFADFRFNMLPKNVSPYLSLGLGYSFDATNSFKGVGLLLDPTLGLSFNVTDKSAFNVGIGYELQSRYFFLLNSSEYISSKNLGAISFLVGFSF